MDYDTNELTRRTFTCVRMFVSLSTLTTVQTWIRSAWDIFAFTILPGKTFVTGTSGKKFFSYYENIMNGNVFLGGFMKNEK